MSDRTALRCNNNNNNNTRSQRTAAWTPKRSASRWRSVVVVITLSGDSPRSSRAFVCLHRTAERKDESGGVLSNIASSYAL